MGDHAFGMPDSSLLAYAAADQYDRWPLVWPMQPLAVGRVGPPQGHDSHCHGLLCWRHCVARRLITRGCSQRQGRLREIVLVGAVFRAFFRRRVSKPAKSCLPNPAQFLHLLAYGVASWAKAECGTYCEEPSRLEPPTAKARCYAPGVVERALETQERNDGTTALGQLAGIFGG